MKKILLVVLSVILTPAYAEVPKLIDIHRGGIGHHQNDLIIAEDCRGESKWSACHLKLYNQNYELAKNFMRDSINYLIQPLNADLFLKKENRAALLDMFDNREAGFQDFSRESCKFHMSCEIYNCSRYEFV